MVLLDAIYPAQLVRAKKATIMRPVRPLAERVESLDGATVEVIEVGFGYIVYAVTDIKGTRHEVSRAENCTWRCDCKAWAFDPDDYCKHCEKVRLWIEEKTLTTEMAVRNNGNELTMTASETSMGQRSVLRPETLDEAMQMAKLFHESGMYQVRSVAQAFVVLAMGMELGLTATQAFRSIHVIKDKPCPSADLMVGLCKRSPACIYFKLVESNNDRAVYETHRRGEDPVTMTFDVEDARRAGVISNDNYRKFPANMYRARAASALAKAVYPDVCAGMYSPEEIEAIDITPRDTRRVVVSAGEAPVVILEQPAGNSVTSEADDIRARLRKKAKGFTKSEWTAQFAARAATWDSCSLADLRQAEEDMDSALAPKTEVPATVAAGDDGQAEIGDPFADS